MRCKSLAVMGFAPRAVGPPYDPVTMFNVLVLASMHNLSDERMRKEEKERARAGESASAIWRGRSYQGRWPDHHGQPKRQFPPPRFP